jgi:hypothetical protein
MGRALMPSMKVDVSSLKRLTQRLAKEDIRPVVQEVAQSKGLHALIAQAIADNFDQQGPGWTPLSPKTIRYSVSKTIRNRMERKVLAAMGLKGKSELKGKDHRAKFARMINSEAASNGGTGEPYRMILQKTGLLKKTVTTPAANSSFSVNGKSGRNLVRLEGYKLKWGTDLSYAKIHQEGSGKVPARPFLIIHDKWQREINEFVAQKFFDVIKKMIKG